MEVVVNDRHPSAGSGPTVPAPDGSYGHYGPYGQQSSQQTYAGYDGHAGYDTGQWAAPGASDTSGQWDTAAQWGVAGHTQTWDFSGHDLGAHDTGQHDLGTYGDQAPTGHGHDHHHSGQWDTSGAHSGQWDTGAWSAAGSAAGSYDTSGQGYQSGPWDTGAYDQAQHQGWNSTGQYAATAWNTVDQSAQPGGPSGQSDPSGQWDISTQQTQMWDTSAYASMDDHRPQSAAEPRHTATVPHTPTLMVDLSEAGLSDAGLPDAEPALAAQAPGARSVADAETRTMSVVEAEEAERDTAPSHQRETAPAPGRSARRKSNAPSRAGYRPRRKALLTVAVPSVAVMGVAGIAAASVVSGGDKEAPKATAAAAPDTSVKLSAANSQLDTQLAGLSRGADDFATRANRTQERIDLKARQDEERKRKAEEAARKERERPKFSLPVTQHGLSAMYGQAGVNWMSVHTGIDFPVSYGTPVMAATDGTVRTQYNVAYGNMAIVTAPDGTETWYCHLSSTKVRSGSVKAGDVIAYSGNSGNSTGPHLHFEVRPGGSAVDPLPWLRSHDLDPT